MIKEADIRRRLMGNLRWTEWNIEKGEHEPTLWFRVSNTARLLDRTGVINIAYEAIGKTHSKLQRQTCKYKYYVCPLWFAPVLLDVFHKRDNKQKLALTLPKKLSQVIVEKP